MKIKTWLVYAAALASPYAIALLLAPPVEAASPKAASANNDPSAIFMRFDAALKNNDYQTAQREGETFEKTIKQKFGQSHEAYGAAMHNLGLVHERIKQFDRAESYYLRALAIRETKGKKTDLAWTLFNLSNLYGQQKKHDKAEPILIRVLQLREQTVGTTHLDTAQTLHNLGVTTRMLGKNSEAAGYLKRAADIRERSKEVRAIDLRWTLANLALANFAIKDIEKARDLARRVIDRADTSPTSAAITSLVQPITNDQDQELRQRYADIQKLDIEHKYREILEAGRRYIEDARVFFGEKHYIYGSALNGMASTLSAFGDYRTSADYLAKSLTADEGAPDPKLYRTIVLNKLAYAHADLQNSTTAEDYFRKAIDIQQSATAKERNDILLASSLRGLSRALRAQRRYEEAIACLVMEREIQERKNGAGTPDAIDSLHSIASIERERGNFSDAEHLHKQALEAKVQRTGPASLQTASSMRWFADFHRISGRYDEAETLYRKALDIRLRDSTTQASLVASTMHDLALTLRLRGKFSEADEFYRKTIDAREKAQGHGHPNTAASINDLGDSYLAQGRYEDAKPLFAEALRIRHQIFGSSDTGAIPIKNNVARLKLIEGDVTGAIALFRDNLNLGIEAFGVSNQRVASSLEELSNALAESGDYQEALLLLQKALTIRTSVQTKDHPDIGQTIYSLAGVLQKVGRFDEAAKMLEQSLRIALASVGELHPDTVATLQRTAEVHQTLKRLDDAVTLSRRAVRLSIELAALDNASTQTDWKGYEDLPTARARLFKSHATLLYGFALSSPAQTDAIIDEAFLTIQRAGNSSASRAMQRASARIAAGGDASSELIRQRQDLIDQLGALENERRQLLVSRSSNTDLYKEKAGYSGISDRIAQIEDRLSKITKATDTMAPRYRELMAAPPLSIKAVQELLQADEAVLVYAVGQENGLVIAVSKEATNWHILNDGLNRMSDKVREFRRGLAPDMLTMSTINGKPDLFDLQRAYELYGELIAPVENVLNGKKRINIIPDGPLTSLPFNLLVTEKPSAAVFPVKDISQYRDQAWLIRRAAIKIVPALSNLQATDRDEAGRRAPRTMIAFGDPIFDPAERQRALAEITHNKPPSATTRAYTTFWQGAGIDRARLRDALPTLLDSGLEVKNIGQQLGVPQTDILVEEVASEANVKRRQLTDYGIVYFATHGLVAGDVRGLAEPSLALSIPDNPNEEDDGLLTLSEVSTLKLNAELVVLSACNTIAGDRPGAEALTGLARAFFYAGAKAMIVSHWALASDAATKIMTDTFRRLQASPSLDRADALRLAMLGYMNDRTNPLNGYPAYWAPFTIVGGRQ